MNEIGELASGIFTSEFDFDNTANSLLSISGWLQNNIGLLNTSIYTNYSGVSPGFEDEERAIFSQLYLHSYYKKQSRAALKGVISDTGSIVELTEADTTVRFANKGEIGKTYRGLARDVWNDLQKLVHSYNLYESRPRQVGGYEAGDGPLS
jgi:hypothetical protein